MSSSQEFPVSPIKPKDDHLVRPPPPSGCDSSSCTYCQGLVTGRRIDLGFCWLRRKLSETELNKMADRGPPSTSHSTIGESHIVPDIGIVVRNTNDLRKDDGKVSQRGSIWEHALIEPSQASAVVARCSASSQKNRKRSNSEMQPWKWNNHYYTLPDPVPSRLLEVANFCPLLHGVQNGGERKNIADSQGSYSANRGGDILCGMEFEQHGWLLATAGVSKEVRLYSLAEACLAGGGETHEPIRTHRLASKLSSLAWNPDEPGVVTVGDYDGVVIQIDLESGHLIAEADEHAGRRVWSVSHSLLRRHCAASGSEDGSVAVWGGSGLREVVGRACPGGSFSVTSVHMSPYDENLLAVGCGDANAYLYDLRRLDKEVAVLQGHSRPVSYIRCMGEQKIVTAAIDASLASWDMGYVNNAQPNILSPERIYEGHVNSKNFVGLCVQPEEKLVACGSEGPGVFVYSLAWKCPLTRFDFLGETSRRGGTWCTAVAWQPPAAVPGGSPLLAAASSDGSVKVLELRQEGST